MGYFLVFIVVVYCYWIVRRFLLGFFCFVVFILVLVVYIFVFFIWSYDIYLIGVGCFYCIVIWIVLFKVLFFCWGIGVGCDFWVELIFLRFVIVMMYFVYVK